MQNIELLISGNVDKEKIEKINQRINLIEDNKMISENKLILKLDVNGLSLINNETELHEDFSKLLNRIKPNNLNSESIIKAAKFLSLFTKETTASVSGMSAKSNSFVMDI